MITASFFNKPLTVQVIEDALIQATYNVVYHSAFQTKKSLLREKKEQFILVSLHKWMKDRKCDLVTVKYVGNLNVMLHLNEFEFHLLNHNKEELSTVKFKMETN